PADLQFFKRTTLGKPIIMGRKTYESIGRPLPGRTNIVITRQQHLAYEGVHLATSLPMAIDKARQAAAMAEQKEFFVIGGADLYAQALPLAQALYITQVQAHIDGDAYFPEWDKSAWQLIRSEHHAVDDANQYAMEFQHFEPAIGI
ncbi:MAG TPA: dihydrofolate reductase, partial [Marinagarivorans sp.]|nr:dihydrofolate reductase [Marinagarivorans sp.]